MPDTKPTSRFTVDLDALAANHATLAGEARGAEVAAMLKANAYGLGKTPVALRLRSCGVRSFFTAGVLGAEALREVLGPEPDIYVLDGCRPGDASRLLAADLTPVLNSPEQVAVWRDAASGRGPLSAALHVDTGMNRLGLRPEQAEDLARSNTDLAGVQVSLVMSHLACGDEPGHPMNARQLALFSQARALFPEARASFANSGGVFLGPEHHFDMVRPGISMFGGGPFGRPDPRIAPVGTLEAEILQVREVPRGETVGYAASFTADAPRTIATVGIGYADGVLRSNQPRAQVWMAGELRAVVGRISMDTMAVDVTGTGARPGDFVELFGENLAVDDAAAAAGTISYELLTSVGSRVERRLRDRV